MISKVGGRASVALLLATQLVALLVAAQTARAQTYTVLHEFTGGDDGSSPTGGVVRDANGNLYGTTSMGGALGFGVLFKLDTAGKETVLHTFDGADGMWPAANLILDSDGNLYGTTFDGGIAEGGHCRHGCGTVFKVDSSGKHSILYAFTGGTDGGNPGPALVRDAAGNFYGTTYRGGDLSCDSYLPGCGVVFKLDKDGKETVLHAFAFTDGSDPYGSLVRDTAGNLYGVTVDGGPSNEGLVFKLDPSGTETILYSFSGKADGGMPSGGFVGDAARNLYGTTSYGGDLSCNTYGCGVIFKLDKSGKETVLYSFGGGINAYPGEILIRDSSGNLYGTTSQSNGEVYEFDNGGKFKSLYALGGGIGSEPTGLIMDSLGDFYGTTVYGGKKSCADGCGVVFKLTP